MVTSFDKQNLKSVRAILQKAFDKIKEEHGIVLSCGTIRFDSTSFRTRLEAHVSGKGTKTLPSKYDSLEDVAISHGYDKRVISNDDVNKEFKLNTWSKETYVILGGQIRAYKFGVLAKDKTTGKEFKFRVQDVAHALGRKFDLSFFDQHEQTKRENIAEGKAEAMSS